METTLKLINYKGRLAGKWTAPKTRRGLFAAIRRLARFYYRCKECGLLLPDIVEILKIHAVQITELAGIMLVAAPQYISALKEIRDLEVSTLNPEIVEERVRKKEINRCSICRVLLKYPAYIVWRKGIEIVKVSKPIGILCLNNRAKKLNDLIVETQIIIDNIKQGSPASQPVCQKENPVSGQLSLF